MELSDRVVEGAKSIIHIYRERERERERERQRQRQRQRDTHKAVYFYTTAILY